MENYWARHFILPSGVIKKVNSICSRFFWKCKIEGKYSARIAWKDVCISKSKGGSGLKDLAIYNQACILRNLWNVFIHAGTLWVSWIECYVLKGTPFLQARLSLSWSWNWNWNWRRIFEVEASVCPVYC